jgi:Flp pilus assembly protein TadG
MHHLTLAFAGDRRGNFAIIASTLAVPLVLGAGVALDLSTISRTRNELQQAMDSAVLAVAREGTSLGEAQANAVARQFLANNYHLKYADLHVVREGAAVRVEATTRAPMAFGALLGYDDWQVAASASADVAYVSYEVALVLDTTGSMAGGKLQSMKNAVGGMIESMSAQIKDKDRLKFSLVPFATFVNVGPEHGPKFDAEGNQIAGTGASWLDLGGSSPLPQSELSTGASRFQLYSNVGKSWPGCVEARPAEGDLDVSDAPAKRADPSTLFVPAFGIDEPDDDGSLNSYIASEVHPKGKSAKEKRLKWAKYGVGSDANGNPLSGGALANGVGLVAGTGGGDDDEDDDDDEDGDGGKAKGKPAKVKIDDGPSGYQGFDKGPEFGCATQPLTPLSNDYAKLRAKLKLLNAQGNTNITEGVAWGNRVLSRGEPFGQAAPKDKPGIEKIMVVLTDGANTIGTNTTKLGSMYSSYGYVTDGRLYGAVGGESASNVAMNKRTLAACETAKKSGVIIYTIRLEEPDVKTGTLLQECATSPEHYFDAPSRSQLEDVFEEIRERVVRLRLAT